MVRGAGWGVASGAGEAWVGEEGGWQCVLGWLDVAGVTESEERGVGFRLCVDEAEGVAELQCCCCGVGEGGSVGGVQWLWGSVCVVAEFECVSLAACAGDEGSVLLVGVCCDSWTTLSPL